MSPDDLKIELAYFEEHRAEFLEKADGKFVLVKGKADHGFYDTTKNPY